MSTATSLEGRGIGAPCDLTQNGTEVAILSEVVPNEVKWEACQDVTGPGQPAPCCEAGHLGS